ncbi:MAG: ABC transporter permease, partial [Armatimonadetes bacterium]|nr:ABC transporter permease [Armatimonadota bacterium]
MQVSSPRTAWKERIVNSLGLLVALAVLIGFFTFKADHFLTVQNFSAIANQIPDAAILAIGMTYVLLIGGIDLSVGSIVGVSGSLLGLALLQWHLPLGIAIPLCLASGALIGFLNGFLTVKFALPSFIVTLGMLEAGRGLAYLLTNSQTQYIGKSVERISSANVAGLTLPFFLALFLAIVAQIVLQRTTFGRHVLAVGSNEEAGRLSGIAVKKVKVVVFSLCGLMAATASIINVSRLASADPNGGTGYELQAIAAVVIGGTSLLGGRGSVVGSVFGVLIIAVLGNGLAGMGAQEPHKRLITGLVILLAVIFDMVRSRLAQRRE